MAEYISVAEARKQSGMRMVLGQGIPGPWAEGIRGILDVKNIPYTRGLFEIGSDHADLIAWTAQASAPAIAWNDEFPKSKLGRAALSGGTHSTRAGADSGQSGRPDQNVRLCQ